MIDKQKELKDKETAHMKKQARKRKQIKSMKKFNITISPQDYKGMNFLGNRKYKQHNCHQFTNQLKDHRLQHLKQQFFINKNILDIGSGDGAISIEIALRYFPEKIVLLDIDEYNLIQAKRRADKIVKQNAKYKSISQNIAIRKHLSQFPLFFQQELQQNIKEHNFKLQTMMQILPLGTNLANKFPKNIYFLNDNFFNLNQSPVYDTVICFGVLKWIHLSLGDDGLEKFINKIYQVLKSDGILIIQYALWRSYKRRQYQNVLFQQNVKKNIKVEPKIIPSYISFMGFQLIEDITKGTNQYPIEHPIAILRKVQHINDSKRSGYHQERQWIFENRKEEKQKEILYNNNENQIERILSIQSQVRLMGLQNMNKLQQNKFNLDQQKEIYKIILNNDDEVQVDNISENDDEYNK